MTTELRKHELYKYLLNDTVKNIYKVSFISGAIIELALTERGLFTLLREQKVSGYKKIGLA